jgi:S1-C subfamily serine protease
MNTSVVVQTPPTVYSAVRAVGTIRPKFQVAAEGRVFADSLDVRGTAFWVKGTSVMITCAHVVQDLVVSPIELAGLLVVGGPRGYLRAIVSIVDFPHDLALLQLPDDTASDVLKTESESGLGFVDRYPSVGEKIGYAGFPGGLQLLDKSQMPTYASGVIGAQMRQRPAGKFIQITGHILSGFSGAPVVLESDPARVLGVVSNSPSSEVGQAGIFLASSWEHARALVALAGS